MLPTEVPQSKCPEQIVLITPLNKPADHDV